jgi:hypothetical protein
VAVLNGHVSDPVEFKAGVRQGCPLSPLLYLFVAQALLAWLKQHGFGIRIGLTHVTAAQYADDCTAILQSADKVPAFLRVMATFATESGQHLNTAKTHLMRIGAVQPTPEPISPPPLTTVTEPETLGIRFSNQPLSAATLNAFWTGRLERVSACTTKLNKMPLSAFGRAFGIGGYALSTLLYLAEYMGPPPPSLLRRLQSEIAAAVDLKGGRLTGIPAAAMPGSPRDGGFGLLPLERHLRARGMHWALQLITAPQRSCPPLPWILVERELQRLKQPTATPLCLLYQRVPSSPGIYHLQSSNTYFTGKVASWPPAHRLFDVMVHLHLPTPSNTPDPGPWLHKAPLFGNPFWSTTPYPLEWTVQRCHRPQPAPSRLLPA